MRIIINIAQISWEKNSKCAFYRLQTENWFLKCMFGLFLLVSCWNKRKVNLLDYHAIGGNETQCEFLTWILCTEGGSHTSPLWVGGWIELEFLPESHCDALIAGNNCTDPLRPCCTFFAAIYNFSPLRGQLLSESRKGYESAEKSLLLPLTLPDNNCCLKAPLAPVCAELYSEEQGNWQHSLRLEARFNCKLKYTTCCRSGSFVWQELSIIIPSAVDLFLSTQVWSRESPGHSIRILCAPDCESMRVPWLGRQGRWDREWETGRQDFQWSCTPLLYLVHPTNISWKMRKLL